MPQNLLLVAFEESLKQRLCALFTQLGFQVVGTTRTKHAMRLLSGDKFDLVIIGHRFKRQERRELSALARHKYDTPVLLVCDGSDADEVPADDVVYVLHGTDALLNAVDRVLRKKAAATSA